jgi:hypothetical protein
VRSLTASVSAEPQFLMILIFRRELLQVRVRHQYLYKEEVEAVRRVQFQWLMEFVAES